MKWRLACALFLFCASITLSTHATTVSESPSVTIPDDDTDGVERTLTVTSSGAIADINVSVEIEHGWLADITITLTHDDTGTSITLLEQAGINDESGDALGCGLDDIDVTFDDETASKNQTECEDSDSFMYGADGTLEYDSGDFTTPSYLDACISVDYQCNATTSYGISGTFVPNDSTGDSLDEFYGEDSNGDWTLKVTDTVSSDEGTLVSWSIDFSDENCGNGTVEGVEECDDGNTDSNDGCSALCATTVDNDSDGYYDDVDCDDTDDTINPGEEEICGDAGSVDEDCDGQAVEFYVWYEDSDSDDYGNLSSTDNDCDQPTGYVSESGDCNDSNSAINPDATEVEDGVDNDCDGTTDEGTDAYDDDGDGYTENDGDCDDTDSSVYPDATEVCDNVDNDCDGTVDDNPTDGTTFYFDGDGDDYGTSSITVDSCDSTLSGYVTNDEDCDDSEDSVYPNAEELCDDMDNDCNDVVDERCTPTEDNDGTGDDDDDDGDDDDDDGSSGSTNAGTTNSSGYSSTNPIKSDVVSGGCQLGQNQKSSAFPALLAMILLSLALTRLKHETH